MTPHFIADDPDLDRWVADGIDALERLLELHAAFQRFLQRLRDTL